MDLFWLLAGLGGLGTSAAGAWMAVQKSVVSAELAADGFMSMLEVLTRGIGGGLVGIGLYIVARSAQGFADREQARKARVTAPTPGPVPQG